jgi:hypothetical protein
MAHVMRSYTTTRSTRTINRGRHPLDILDELDTRPPLPITLTHQATISAPEPGWEPIAWNVTASAEALVLCVHTADRSLALGRNARGSALSQLPRAIDALLLRYRHAHLVEARPLQGLRVAFPLIELLHDGSALVCGRWCARYPTPSTERAAMAATGHMVEASDVDEIDDASREHVVERNAQVFDRSGVLTRELTIGDDVTALQVGMDGAIWAGYGDTGIFGNHGWGALKGTSPLGESGLVRFTDAGKQAWERPRTDAWPRIAHIHALNVAQTLTWEYALYAGSTLYTNVPTSFTLTRIRADAPRVWESPVDGARAIALGGDEPGAGILLWGGYRQDRTRCVAGILGETTIDPLRRVTLLTEQQTSLTDSGAPEHHHIHQVIGRENRLHIFADAEWWTADVPIAQLISQS